MLLKGKGYTAWNEETLGCGSNQKKRRLLKEKTKVFPVRQRRSLLRHRMNEWMNVKSHQEVSATNQQKHRWIGQLLRQQFQNERVRLAWLRGSHPGCNRCCDNHEGLIWEHAVKSNLKLWRCLEKQQAELLGHSRRRDAAVEECEESRCWKYSKVK